MQNRFLKIGHRGAMGHVAENTLESIQKAMDFGVDGVEIDVHRCASGELVVFHDFTLDRMTDGSGEVSKHTLSELKNLQVKGRHQIPTLEEVLDFIDAKILINIELKGKNTSVGVVNIIDNYINNSDWEYRDFLVSSFQHKELEKVSNLNNNIELSVLTKASIDEALEFAQTIKAKTLHPNIALVSQANVAYAQSLNFKVNVWTANDTSIINRMKLYGVDGIISDYPDRL